MGFLSWGVRFHHRGHKTTSRSQPLVSRLAVAPYVCNKSKWVACILKHLWSQNSHLDLITLSPGIKSASSTRTVLFRRDHTHSEKRPLCLHLPPLSFQPLQAG